MAILYTYKPTELFMAPSLDGLTDVVTRVRYDYTGVEQENGLSAVFMGSTPVPPPVDPSGFVPLQDLTEAEVVAWLEAVVEPSHMQSVIIKNIDNQINPKFEPTPLPWAPPSGTVDQPVVEE
jgi:hypothetical protein